MRTSLCMSVTLLRRMMSEFIRHEACSKCGSSDAKAVYVGGGAFCFSCRTAFRPTTSPYLLNHLKDGQKTGNSAFKDGKIYLPEGCTKEYSKETLGWIGEFGLGPTDILNRGVYSYSLYNKYKEHWLRLPQTIFSFYSRDSETSREYKSSELRLYQARNHSSLAKQKYFTKGNPNEVIPIYYFDNPGRRTGVLTIVEDCLSAIKIASVSDAMPVLGSSLSPIKLKRLAGLYGTFLIWLDGNMFHKAQEIAQRLQFLGTKAKAVYTEKDPKCYESVKVLDFLDDLR